jgi:uncharacterized damage-inducible protein DinB
MNNREFCLSRRKAEFAAFQRVLKAVPADRLDYKPDPRSRSAAALTWLLAEEEASLVKLIDTGRIEWKETAPPADYGAVVAAFETAYAAVDERLAKMDDAAWERKVSFVVEGMPEPWTDSLSEFVWGFLFDEVHHRGQLSTYLRPMGGKVPSIYGPSADSAPA